MTGIRKHADSVYSLLAVLLAVAIMVAFEPGIFLGSQLIGFDATTEYYPWYVNALLAFHHGPFTVLNPFMDGGSTNYNLFANYDPVYLLPLLTGRIPSLFQEQLLVLAHLLVVPACLVALARLYGISGMKLLLVAALGAAAGFTGHILNLLSESIDLNCYGWAFVAITAIEYYRVKKRLPYAVGAAVAVNFSLMISDGGAAYWPLFVIPYVAVCWREFRGPTFVRDAAIACGVLVLLSLPGLVERAHQWRTIQTVATDLTPKQFANPRDALAYFGFHFSPAAQDNQTINQSLFAIPGAIGLMLLAAFERMSRRERWLFGSLLGVLFVSALGSVTPLEQIVRHVYPPAGMFRRAYEDLNVAIPVTFVLVVRYFVTQERLGVPWRAWVAAALAGLFLLAVRAEPSQWPVNLAVTGLSIAFLYVARWPAAAATVLVAQWVLVVFMPVTGSIFAPHDRAAVEYEINVATFEGLGPFLADRGTDSGALYRVAGVGVIPTFGNYAGVRRFYNLVSHVPESRTPRELYTLTGVTEAGVEASIRANPSIVASPSLRGAAVRYYVLSNDDADIERAVRHGHPELRSVPVAGPYRVLEDPRAFPFVSALRPDSTL
ncbi:MAG TPA: hypothetical protein VK760_03855, partial [Candidatus Acidoferrales bacterium]|nr:hypothetical protein [Candidatus Acidoferrales bacterium]